MKQIIPAPPKPPSSPLACPRIVEPLLRDTRHLAGRKPISSTPEPDERGLALRLRHDPHGAAWLLVGRTDGTLQRIGFQDSINLLVEEDRRCTGNIDDGHWMPCAHNRPADRFSRCMDCHPLPVRECVFNPRCADCTNALCMGPHEVYIAFHGTRAKVGMTRLARDGARLVEQGADAWFRVQVTADRFQARNLEDRITALLGVPQSVPIRKRLGRLTEPQPRQAIKRQYDDLAPRLRRIVGDVGPLQTLPPGTGRPVPEPPLRVGTVGHHVGHTIAASGPHLIYKTHPGSPPWTLDLKDVVSHRIGYAPPPPRDETA